uniref:Uncharacterized protein n=1 Tax=Onchocerca volvulus TaxID=6282 RepID=A0A8R1XJY8_ONCVO
MTRALKLQQNYKARSDSVSMFYHSKDGTNGKSSKQRSSCTLDVELNMKSLLRLREMETTAGLMTCKHCYIYITEKCVQVAGMHRAPRVSLRARGVSRPACRSNRSAWLALSANTLLSHYLVVMDPNWGHLNVKS